MPSFKNPLRAVIVFGEGIQCENETLRFLQIFKGSSKGIQKVPVSEILEPTFWDRSEIVNSQEGPLFFVLPGGFSFADHFQSGRLLSYVLTKAKFFERAIEKKAQVLGICNGFQVLVQSQIFGAHTKLLHNQNGSFVNRWVHLETKDKKPLALPVRHGEGCFRYSEKEARLFSPFLFYRDKDFNNGSSESIAGVFRQIEKSTIWGLMPHPEIALRNRANPYFKGPPFQAESQSEDWNLKGDGLFLFETIYKAAVAI
jgi:phosphoribosylformylglycinamidine (FGAM) synthase-like amidotransferase family enzyme